MNRLQLSAAALSLATAAGIAAPSPAGAEEIALTLWSRADRSGPMRPANIIAAAEVVNQMLAAAGSEDTVKVEVFENNATGFDQDALDMLQAFAVDKAPDFYVAAHEWVGEFARNDYAMNLEQFVKDNPWAFADVIPVLWEATKYQGEIYAIPQDSEIRMFFYNKDMLRKIGKDEAFIEAIPAKVESGEMTIWDFGELVKEVVDGGAAEMGMLHRPNAGPDYLMTFATFGVKFQDPDSGKLLLPRAEMQKALEWYDWMARNGATPRTTPRCPGTTSRTRSSRSAPSPTITASGPWTGSSARRWAAPGRTTSRATSTRSAGSRRRRPSRAASRPICPIRSSTS
jgi:inositol-phosphate transport system substrate-binding protein